MTDVFPFPTSEEDLWDEPSSDRDAEIRRAKEEMAGPVPLIADAPNCRIELPRGLPHDDQWLKRIELRELTGADEEMLAKAREGEIFDTLIALGVVRCNDLDVGALPLGERRELLGQLLIGERDQLFLAIIRATYGNEKTLVLTCRFCEFKQDLELNLGKDFSSKTVENVSDATFFFTTSRGERLEVRPATGADQMAVIERKGASLPEQNTIILSRCILSADDGVVVDPLGFARSMSMRDRQTLLAEMIDRQPNVDLRVTVTCVACDEEQEVPLVWADIFRI